MSQTVEAHRVDSRSKANDVPSFAQLDSELVVLRAQNQLLRDFQADVLDTVYWSLGGVLLVTGLLLGFGWFANFRVYARDKDALRQELLGIIKQDQAAQSAVIRSEAEAHRKQADDTIAALRQDAVNVARSAATGDINRLESKLNEFELGLIKLRADLQKSRGSHSMVVTESIKWLRLALEQKDNYEIGNALKTMLEAVQNRGRFTQSEMATATALLRKVSEDHAIVRDEIIAKLDVSLIM